MGDRGVLRLLPLLVAVPLLLISGALHVPVPAAATTDGACGVPLPFDIPAPSVVQTTTAQRTTTAYQNWNQTGSTVYAGHSEGWTNFTATPGGTVTSVFTTTATFSVTLAGAHVARILVYQGSTVLANTTSDLFTVHPSVSSTKVTERVVSVANTTGGAPSVAVYNVTTVLSYSVQFDIVSSTGNWTYNNTTYRTHWYVNATSSFWFNATTVSIPLVPGAAVNVSSLSVTVNGSAAAYQLTSNSAYVLLTAIPPGISDAVNVSFRPSPTLLASPPNLWFAVFTDHDGLYTGQVDYTDYTVPAYNGLYLLHINSTDPIVNVSVSANGHAFLSSQLSRNGNNVTVLPGAFTVYRSTQVLWLVTFNTVPPLRSLPGNSIALITSGNSTLLTLGDVLLSGIVLDAVYIAVALAGTAGGRRSFRTLRTAAGHIGNQAGPILVLVALVLFYLVGSLAG